MVWRARPLEGSQLPPRLGPRFRSTPTPTPTSLSSGCKFHHLSVIVARAEPLFLRAAADGDFTRRGDDAELPCDPFVQFRPGIAAEATGEDLKAGTAPYDAQLS